MLITRYLTVGADAPSHVSAVWVDVRLIEYTCLLVCVSLVPLESILVVQLTSLPKLSRPPWTRYIYLSIYLTAWRRADRSQRA